MSVQPPRAPEPRPDNRFEETLFNLDKTKTIALIVATVLILAGAGALAGALGDDGEAVLVPNSGSDLGGGSSMSKAPSVADLGVSTGPLAGGAVQPQVSPSPIESGAGTSPSPLPSSSTTTPDASTSPSTGATPGTSPSPGATPDGSTTTTTGFPLGGGVATVPVPEPWANDWTNDDGTQATFSDGRGTYVWVGVFSVDPATDASATLGTNWQNFISADHYSDLQSGEVNAQQPVGSMTSFAGMAFQGLWTDDQGSAEYRGEMWLAIRADGSMVVMSIETSPPEHIEQSYTDMGDMYGGTFRSFAGL
jgi:hypothetical protein